jgi:hypothetical protein
MADMYEVGKYYNACLRAGTNLIGADSNAFKGIFKPDSKNVFLDLR